MAASMLTLYFPFIIDINSSLSSRRRRNIVSCSKRLYTPLKSKLVDHVTSNSMETSSTINRRSANYAPSLWSYDFIQSLSSQYSGEKYMARSQTLKEIVRTVIWKEKGVVENPSSILGLVDDLQRLGISYLFESEISDTLKKIHSRYYKSNEEWMKMDLNLKSLGFRLLRQHGYHIPQEIFHDVIDENGDVKEYLCEDMMGMLNLYEACFHAVENESILDYARIFTTKYLKQCLDKINTNNDDHDQSTSTTLSLVSRALVFPLRWMPPRVDIKWFIQVYEGRSDMNPSLLDLAKLDFNMVQAVYQQDLKYASRWWKETRWENFDFARDHLVENFMWSVTENYLPQFKGRRDLTKVNAMITTIDDIYDVYGTLPELEQFTRVVNSWDINEIEKLPDYMKICFHGLYNAINDMSYKALVNQEVFVLPFFKKTWQDLCKSFIIEANWFNSGYTPTLEEYLENGFMSTGLVPIIKHAYLLTLPTVSEDSLKRIEIAGNMIRYACQIVRLNNDLGTSFDELERGDVPKSIQCYMHQSGAKEAEAREYIKQLTMETWKKLNREQREVDSEFAKEFIEFVINLARMGHFIYTNGDKDGKPDMFKPYVLSLFVNPISIANII